MKDLLQGIFDKGNEKKGEMANHEEAGDTGPGWPCPFRGLTISPFEWTH